MGRRGPRGPGRRPQPRPPARRLTTYVSFLRGVNLGRRNRLAMADLRRVLERSGLQGVETYLQSGNAVFESGSSAAELERMIAEGIAGELGLTVEVLVRSRAELEEIVAGNPFAGREGDPKRLHVTFLAAEPDPDRLAALPPGDGPDRLHAAGREVYLHTPEGYGRSKLSNAFLERTLKVAGTTRNWRTVTALVELAATRRAT